MKILTYLGFTLLSILIQFCVMDLIQEKMKLDKEIVDLNITSQKKSISGISDITSKPHALYYQTQAKRWTAKAVDPKTNLFQNSSLIDVTEISTGVTTGFEVLYDENVSFTDTTTTDNYFTDSEFDNVTEITLFDKKNHTHLIPNDVPKTYFDKEKCSCNLLYQVCDINCCCDIDCSDKEQKLFARCDDEKAVISQNDYFCDSQVTGNINNLICISQVNLPEKKNVNKQDVPKHNKYYKWNDSVKTKFSNEFTRAFYKYGDPIWLLQNGSIYYIDLPSPVVNDYCTSRKPIKFLKDEHYKCYVKMKDLEMFQISKFFEEATLITVTENYLNNSILNCSALHCTNWTLFACDDVTCINYNRSLHEPMCNESVCTNLVFKIDYIFQYYDAKIINVTVKLYVEKISIIEPFMEQEINVKFYLTNKSIENIIEVSGNPGYIKGLPIIVSFATSNHTQHFIDSNTVRKKHLFNLTNKNGKCLNSNMSNSIVEFGVNKKIKCRFLYKHDISHKNVSASCKLIQNEIKEFLGLDNNNKWISPYGNPSNIKDADWILLQHDILNEKNVYGEFLFKKSKFRCYNLINKMSLIFFFADVSKVRTKEENKILKVNVNLLTKNVTFDEEDVSTMISMDSIFLDTTKPAMFEYAGSPHLNIHLPKDFFYPFPSNKNNINKCNISVILYLCFVAYNSK